MWRLLLGWATVSRGWYGGQEGNEHVSGESSFTICLLITLNTHHKPGTVLGPETKWASPSDMAPALGELTFQWGEAGSEVGGTMPCAE